MRQAYLGSVLAVILILSAVSTAYAAEPGAKVFAKEKQGTILLLIKNGTGQNIYGIKLKVSNGEINSVQTPAGWTADARTPDTTIISLSTKASPIRPGGQSVILLKASEANTILSWSLMNQAGALIGAADSKTVVRQTVQYNQVAEPEALPELRSMTVATDKVVYSPNDKMIISGKLKPKADLTITIYTPAGEKIKITDETDAYGTFKILHILRDAGSGTYHLKVRQSEASVETVFRVL